MDRIVYTFTDESPMLATASFLPIVRAFARSAQIEVALADISLAGRILGAMSEFLPVQQRCDDDLAALAALTLQPEANIIKLPNISASLPQLQRAIKELQEHGYDLPDYPENPETSEEFEYKKRYDAVKGSAVNPVLREGNSDRRAPLAVKNYARKHPHSMGSWSLDSRTRVATMDANDFRSTEQSVVLADAGTVDLVFIDAEGHERALRTEIAVDAGEIFDVAKIDAAALDAFLREQVDHAKQMGLLFSVHLKATMMKVSDPVIFAHVVKAMFPQTFAKFGERLEAAQLFAHNGLASIFAGLNALEGGAEIRASFDAELAAGPDLAMVNSDQGITNLHVPSDVIVDASMPAMIRNGGKMWDADGQARDTLAVIPDSSYAGIYQAVIDDCRTRGALDPATMGSVPNVGLMAKKAEEYGSHDKTFIMDAAGRVELRASDGAVLLALEVNAGDIFRGCQTKDEAVRDWVALAVRRARISQTPAVFWLDDTRAHDRALQQKVQAYLAKEDTAGLSLRVLSPIQATQFTLDTIRAGGDVISVTGNVLRDYLTDLFPIMELGTSAKMLSVVPLMAGGGMFETGAGGSAPKHVQQLVEENHLRWDSLGEFLALAESLRQLERVTGNSRAGVLATALDAATEELLDNGKSPQRHAGELDNRGSHAWLALWWAKNLAQQKVDTELATLFEPFAKDFAAAIDAVDAELRAAQGKQVDLGGYYHPDREKLDAAMRPSATLNQLIDGFARD